jgi:hypothetical protein
MVYTFEIEQEIFWFTGSVIYDLSLGYNYNIYNDNYNHEMD